MFEEAQIVTTTGRRLTGHFGRVTMHSVKFNAGFSKKKKTWKKTGQRSDSVRTYISTNSTLKQKVNDV